MPNQNEGTTMSYEDYLTLRKSLNIPVPERENVYTGVGETKVQILKDKNTVLGQRFLDQTWTGGSQLEYIQCSQKHCPHKITLLLQNTNSSTSLYHDSFEFQATCGEKQLQLHGSINEADLPSQPQQMLRETSSSSSPLTNSDSESMTASKELISLPGYPHPQSQNLLDDQDILYAQILLLAQQQGSAAPSLQFVPILTRNKEIPNGPPYFNSLPPRLYGRYGIPDIQKLGLVYAGQTEYRIPSVDIRPLYEMWQDYCPPKPVE